MSMYLGEKLQGGQSCDKSQLHVLCISIWTEPVSKLAIGFLKLNEIL